MEKEIKLTAAQWLTEENHDKSEIKTEIVGTIFAGERSRVNISGQWSILRTGKEETGEDEVKN